MLKTIINNCHIPKKNHLSIYSFLRQLKKRPESHDNIYSRPVIVQLCNKDNFPLNLVLFKTLWSCIRSLQLQLYFNNSNNSKMCHLCTALHTGFGKLAFHIHPLIYFLECSNGNLLLNHDCGAFYEKQHFGSYIEIASLNISSWRRPVRVIKPISLLLAGLHKSKPSD